VLGEREIRDQHREEETTCPFHGNYPLKKLYR
jgi:hypothetical protein